jgi:hypothetical protein
MGSAHSLALRVWHFLPDPHHRIYKIRSIAEDTPVVPLKKSHYLRKEWTAGIGLLKFE